MIRHQVFNGPTFNCSWKQTLFEVHLNMIQAETLKLFSLISNRRLSIFQVKLFRFLDLFPSPLAAQSKLNTFRVDTLSNWVCASDKSMKIFTRRNSIAITYVTCKLYSLFIIVIFSTKHERFYDDSSNKTNVDFNRFMTWKKSKEKERSLNDQTRGLLMTFIYPNRDVDGLKNLLRKYHFIYDWSSTACSGGYFTTVMCEEKMWKNVLCFFFVSWFLEIHPTVTRPDRVQRKSLSEVIKVHEQLQFAFGGRISFYLPLEALVEFKILI